MEYRINNTRFEQRSKSFWIQCSKDALDSALKHRSKKIRTIAQRFAAEHPAGYYWDTIGEHQDRMCIGFTTPYAPDLRQSIPYERCLRPLFGFKNRGGLYHAKSSDSERLRRIY